MNISLSVETHFICTVLGDSSCVTNIDAIDLERIYVHHEYQGDGIGGLLLKKIEITKTRTTSYIWFGVWENSNRVL